MAGFKSPQQRIAFFEALKNKASGLPPATGQVMKAPMGAPNPMAKQPGSIPMAAPIKPAATMPSMSPGINKPINSMPTNPAGIAPPAPMNFLKLRRTLKPKV